MWEIVEVAKPGDLASRVFDVSILSLIWLNVVAAVIGTLPAAAADYRRLLGDFEAFSVAIFTVEYLARLWSCTVDSRYSGPIRGRVRLAFSPLLLVDLAAILPFYMPWLGLDLRVVRVLRLFRVLRMGKLVRYTRALRVMSAVLKAKREELVLAMILMLMLLLVTSSLLFYLEHDAQPQAFSSIPAAMWWAIITMTTVGYGDIYPVTVAGRLVASLVAVMGVAMFALPAGILGAGFTEELRRKRARVVRCPRCGAELGDG